MSDSNDPDNETLRNLGAFERKCRIGKHQATNWAHLRQTIEALDAAGHSDAADTLIWTVWHEVNGVARAREYYDIVVREREEARAEVARWKEEAANLDGMAEASRVKASKHLVLGDEVPAAYWRGRARGLQLAAHNLRLSPTMPLPAPSPVEES